MKYLYKIFVIFLLLQTIECKKKSRTINYLATECDANPHYVKNCHTGVSADKTTISVLFETTAKFTELWTTIEISIWQPAPFKTYRTIFAYDIDLCRTLITLKTANIELVNSWVSNFLKYGNWSDRCPIQKSVYAIDQLKVEKDSIPAFAPSGKYRAAIAFYQKEDDGSKDVCALFNMTLSLK